MDKHFESNMQALWARDKNLADRMRTLVPDGSLELAKTASGEPTVRLNAGNGVCRFIHSRGSPAAEARIWSDHQTTPGDGLVILGFGLGYHVIELLKRQNNPRPVYIIEAHEPLFRLSLEVVNFSSIMESDNVHFLIGKDILSVKRILSHNLYKLFSYHVFLPATSLDAEFYAAVIRMLDDHLFRSRLNCQRDANCSQNDVLAGGVEKLINVMKSA